MLRHRHVLPIVALALLAGTGTGLAQVPAPAAATSVVAATPAPVAHQVIKPGDRLCVRQTGSRIRQQDNHCLGVAGRSYSGDELRHTGAPDTARALQMLDPSVRRGH